MKTDDVLKALCAAATPGPWHAPLKDLGAVESFKAVDYYLEEANAVYDFEFFHSYEAYPPLGYTGPIFVASGKENAAFIAAARAALPALLERVARAEAALADIWDASIEDLRGDGWCVHSVHLKPETKSVIDNVVKGV